MYNTVGFYGMGIEREQIVPNANLDLSGGNLTTQQIVSVSSLSDNPNGVLHFEATYMGKEWRGTFDPATDALLLEQGKHPKEQDDEYLWGV